MDELGSLIRIQSVSAKVENKPQMLECASRWAELLLAAGAQRAEVMQTAGNPVVYAEYRAGEDLPTVLIYAHYDVMPVEPLELWLSDPFEPSFRDGKIYARGADDDKGQSMMQVKGFETALRTGNLRVNVKFIFEGEEEIGSPSLEEFCKTHKELLRADIILVSDTSMVSADVPSLTTGLRGLAYWEIEVTGPNRDLHSGHFGGAVANPINVLCEMLASVIGEDGRITVEGFYDDVEELSSEERAMIAQIPFDETAYKAAIGVRELRGEAGYTTLERNSCRPSFDVCGIWGNLGRIYGRRLEDGASVESVRQGVVPPGASPEPRKDFAPLRRLFPTDSTEVRARQSNSDARGRGLCLPDNPSGIPCGRGCGGTSLRKTSAGRAPRREHTYYLDV